MNGKEWFESWYASPYYRICYDLDHKDVQEEFLDRMVHILSLNPGDRLLEIGCNFGREALYLESLDYDVTGLDLSTTNIQEALQLESETLGFYEHDMRSAFWINYYDCAVSLFSNFGFYDTYREQILWLTNARKSLRKGGRIVIDFMNVDYMAENLVDHIEFSKGPINFIMDSSIVDGQLIKEIKVIDGDQCHIFSERIRAFTLDDFSDMFKKAGLKIDVVYGTYKLDGYDHNDSDRLIVVGSKK